MLLFLAWRKFYTTIKLFKRKLSLGTAAFFIDCSLRYFGLFEILLNPIKMSLLNMYLHKTVWCHLVSEVTQILRFDNHRIKRHYVQHQIILGFFFSVPYLFCNIVIHPKMKIKSLMTLMLFQARKIIFRAQFKIF